MDKYIDVVGAGFYHKPAKEFKLKLEIYSNSGFSRVERYEARKVIENIVSTVTENDFPKEQIIFGGMDDHVQWWRKGHHQSNATQLLFIHDDQDILFQIPVWIEKLSFGKLKHKFVNLPPVFEAPQGAKEKAFSDAILNAKEIANSIATASNVKIGTLIHAQDLGFSKRGSGYQGDEDWGDHNYDTYRGIAVAAAGGTGFTHDHEMQSMDLGTPKQTVTVRLKARFSIEEL